MSKKPVIKRGYKRGVDAAIDAMNIWIDEELSYAKIYLATVVGVTAGVVTLIRHTDDTQDDEEYAQLRGFDVEPGDLIAITKHGEDTIVLGTLQYAQPANLPISSRLRIKNNVGIWFNGNTPTITAGAAAGTAPSVSVIGDDYCGRITIVTGTTPAIGILATINFDSAKTSTNYAVMLSNADSDAATLFTYASYADRTVNNWTLRCTNGPSSGTSYFWFYRIDYYS